MRKQALIDFIIDREGLIIGREVFECPRSAAEVITQLPAWEKDEVVIDLFDDFGCGIAIFTINGELCHYFANEDEAWKIKIDGKEDCDDWMLLSDFEKSTIERYLFLLAAFRKNPDALSFSEKKWVLSNADCKSHLYPLTLMPKEFATNYSEEQLDKKIKESLSSIDNTSFKVGSSFDFGHQEKKIPPALKRPAPLSITVDGVDYFRKGESKDYKERLKQLTDASNLPAHLGELFLEEIKQSTCEGNKHLRDRIALLGLV